MSHASFPRLILEMALIKMATLAPAIPVQELLSRLAALESSPRATRSPAPAAATLKEPRQGSMVLQDSGSVPTSAAVTSPPLASPAPPLGDADALWASLVRFVKGKKPRLGSELEQLHPVTVSGELLEVGCLAGSYQLKMMQDPEQLAELKALALAHFGVPTVVRIAVLKELPSDVPPTLLEKKNHEDARHKLDMRRSAEEHPLVAAVVTMYDGEIVGVKELKKTAIGGEDV
jgi:DNA polymerase-3 subunit gamma/tau